MTDAERIEWIDGASYEQLLRRNRFAPVGDPMFQGAVGDHFMAVMAEKRAAEPDHGVGASKRIGWD